MDAEPVQEDVGSLPVEAVVEADLKVRHGAAATRALAVPLAFTLGLASFLLLDSVQHNMALWRSVVGAVAVLLAWNAALAVSAADPLNFLGILTPDDRVAATARAQVRVA